MSTRRWSIMLAIILVIALVMPGGAVFAKGPPDGGGGGGGGDHGPPDIEASNNLSWPVLQPDTAKVGYVAEDLTGPVVYCWDADEDEECDFYCEKDPTEAVCYDDPQNPVQPPFVGFDEQAATYVPELGEQIELYEQKTSNKWSAGFTVPDDHPGSVHVKFFDWGDNLESKDWRLGAMVRVEARLIADMTEVMLSESWGGTLHSYRMYHIVGEGIDERWGTTGETEPTTEPIVQPNPYIYAEKAQLIIQEISHCSKLGKEPSWDADQLLWICGDLETGTVAPLVVDPLDFSTEVNVGGYLIYGYRWVTRDCKGETCAANEEYRLTFALPKGEFYSVTIDGETEIYSEAAEEPEEPHAASIVEEPSGNVAEVGPGYSFIDVMLTQGSGRGGKKIRSLELEREMEREQEREQSCDCDCAFECGGDEICQQECEQECQENHNQNGDDAIQGQGDQEQEREQERERNQLHLYLPFVTNR